jgi:hypothetical protein
MGYFSWAFNTSFLHQIWQRLHENNHPTSYYTPVWYVLTDWHHIYRGSDPKRPTQTAFNYQIWQFMLTTLNQLLGSFRDESRAKIWHHKRQHIPLPPPINRGKFHGLSRKKSEAKLGEKPIFPLVFLPLSFSFLFPLYHHDPAVAATTLSSIFHPS